MKETILDSDFLILNRIPELYSARRFQEEINGLKLNGSFITPEQLNEYLPQFETRGLRPALLYRQGDYRFWETHAIVTQWHERIGRVVNPPTAFFKRTR